MALTGSQMSICLQNYWYMWLTNSLTGFILLGIQIGIGAFFLKKHLKPRTNLPPPAERVQPAKRPVSAEQINVATVPVDFNPIGDFTPRATSATSADSTIEDNLRFANTTLQAINTARGKHTSPPLELNPELSEIAQRLAEQMAKNSRLEHSPPEYRTYRRQVLGETYAATFQTELTGNTMVKKWMKEGRRYMFGYDGRKDNENFTQLVWRSTQEIGVGRARSEDGNWWYGVVVYDPAGNIPGQYSSNVLLPAQ